MSIKNGEMHAVSGILAAAFTAALITGIYLWRPVEICDDKEQVDEDTNGFANCADTACKTHCACLGTCPVEKPTEQLTIDASLAFKAEPEKPKQPQKEFKEKEKKIAPEGVSRDETKAADQKTCTKDTDCAETDECIKHVCTRRKNTQTADTTPTGKVPDRTNVDNDLPSSDNATPKVGVFDGSKFGRGVVSKGDPYFGRLNADLDFKPPEIAKTDNDYAEGCIHIQPDGKIPEIKFTKKTSDDLTPLAEKALNDLQVKRNKDPEPVPTHLLEALTTQWICFKFTAKAPD